MTTPICKYTLLINGRVIISTAHKLKIDDYVMALMKDRLMGVLYDAYYTMQSDSGHALCLDEDTITPIFNLLNNKSDIGDDYIDITIRDNPHHNPSTCCLCNPIMPTPKCNVSSWWLCTNDDETYITSHMTTLDTCNGVLLKYRRDENSIILHLLNESDLSKEYVNTVQTPRSVLDTHAFTIRPYTFHMHIMDAMNHVNKQHATHNTEHSLSSAMAAELDSRFYIKQESAVNMVYKTMDGKHVPWYSGRVDMVVYNNIQENPIAFIEFKKTVKTAVDHTSDVAVNGANQLNQYVHNSHGNQKPLTSYLCVFKPGDVYIQHTIVDVS